MRVGGCWVVIMVFMVERGEPDRMGLSVSGSQKGKKSKRLV